MVEGKSLVNLDKMELFHRQIQTYKKTMKRKFK